MILEDILLHRSKYTEYFPFLEPYQLMQFMTSKYFWNDMMLKMHAHLFLSKCDK